MVRKAPIAPNVIDYAVKLSVKTRPNEELATEKVKKYISWGAGPRASQFLVLGAKCNALLNGKYSPDIEDVVSVAVPILRHRIMRNYKAEADGVSIEQIIIQLSFLSRTTSISNSFQPITDSSIKTSLVGERSSPLPTISSKS